MVPTKDVTVRATLCAGCHVGGPGREVGHDLIAVGHPRLNFELTSKLSKLPKHWDDAAERRSQPDLEARIWAIGQFTSALAATEVLHARAEAARNGARRKESEWPEFAEYDCFGCHHNLAVPSWRQGRLGNLVPGTLEWGSWYWAMIPALSRHSGITALDGPDAALTKLGKEMSRTLPDPEVIAATAGQLAGELKSWLGRDPGQLVSDKTRGSGLLVSLVRDGQTRDGPSWDRMKQLSLALAALLRARADRGEPYGPESESALRELVRQLEFPRGYDSPRDRGRLIPGPVGGLLGRFLSEAARTDHERRAREGSAP
jgi:hypothetical protein